MDVNSLLQKIWPDWKLKELIGAGQYGKVYRIERKTYGHVFSAALKVIEIPSDENEISSMKAIGMDEISIQDYFSDTAQSLKKEIDIMQELKSSANIVTIEDSVIIEKEDQIGWIILIRMELLESLSVYAQKQKLKTEDYVKLGADMCSAITDCEKAGIIHRDIKPENIFINKFGTYKLGDFGIARRLEQTKATMSKKGTELYMAPEVIFGKKYDSTVDIYSLGIMLYRFLNKGRMPFYPQFPEKITQKSVEEALQRKNRGDEFPKPCDADEELSRIILKACAYNPKERYQKAEEMRSDLLLWDINRKVEEERKKKEEEEEKRKIADKTDAGSEESFEKSDSIKENDHTESENDSGNKHEDNVLNDTDTKSRTKTGDNKESVSADFGKKKKSTRSLNTVLICISLAAALIIGLFVFNNKPEGTLDKTEEVTNHTAEPTEETEEPSNHTETVTFPLAEKETISGLTNYPIGTESNPNNRTIFRRLEEKTNVHVEWKAIQSDQWADQISLEMSNIKTLPDFVFNAGFGDTDLLRYAKQGVILNLEDYIDAYMPNLKKVFEQFPEYRKMCEDENGHIWALPWIEQLGSEKTAIQTIDSMPFINKAWLDFLGLQVPTNVDEFENVLIAFRDNANQLKAEFKIDGSIIPMSFIMNDGGQDPMILINGFGEGYGDPDKNRHIVVTDDKKVVCPATTEGWKKGIQWMHKLYEEGLIDKDAFTQDWSTYVAKGKSGRYGVCFSWDVSNIAAVSMDDLIAGKSWVPLPALGADVKNITPANGSFTSGFDRGRCVVTSTAQNPALICAWLDQMYDPFQSPQNNWGTYGEDDDFDTFEVGLNENGDPMLKHAWLGDASPLEVREAECVGGPLAVLDSYYDVYVTCPDDAQYRLDWIKNIYTPDMNGKYVYPNVFMTADDAKKLTNLQADIAKIINTAKSDWVMNGFTDADWDRLQNDLYTYGLEEYLFIFQKYADAYFE